MIGKLTNLGPMYTSTFSCFVLLLYAAAGWKNGQWPAYEFQCLHVAGRDLHSNKLTGTISTAVGNLTSLKYLYRPPSSLSESTVALWCWLMQCQFKRRAEFCCPRLTTLVQLFLCRRLQNNYFEGPDPCSKSVSQILWPNPPPWGDKPCNFMVNARTHARMHGDTRACTRARTHACTHVHLKSRKHACTYTS